MKFTSANVYISPKAHIGENVKVGNNSIIYDNVFIGDNSIIANDCVIGEPNNDYYSNINAYENPSTFIGNNALIRSHSIIYSGCQIQEGFATGHRVTIRENSIFGKHCRIGTLSDIQGHVKFGDFCWLHSSVHIGQNSVVGNFVFIYPYVILTNDPHPPSNICKGPRIGDFSQIAVGSVILPDISIGKHCLIGAQSLVNRNVNDFELVSGNPARVLKDVRELKSKDTGKSHYPWPYNFERGMPWEGQVFDDWFIKSEYSK
jgi:UDP-3-O-[3-hydroxymyristoyl] glucosamine N-acyltransferase